MGFGSANENLSCRNTGLSSGKQWDVYAVCGLAPEEVSDEVAACMNVPDNCEGEECFVAWSDFEASWKCAGANQSHNNEPFGVCVSETVATNSMWMNYRSNNG